MASERERCEAHIDQAIEGSAAIRQLMTALERAGCPVTRQFFSCEHCPMDCLGGYDKDRGVVLCEQNMLNSRVLTETTLVHELIHAFDDCRSKLNWLDLKHHACTEIRASNLSGDCTFVQELYRGNWALRAQQQKCVRRRAELSVAMNPSSEGACSPIPSSFPPLARYDARLVHQWSPQARPR